MELSRPSWLRVKRVANTWTFDYSTNGTSWTNVGSFSLAITVNKVGLWFGNALAGTSPAFTGIADYFKNLNDPVQTTNAIIFAGD